MSYYLGLSILSNDRVTRKPQFQNNFRLKNEHRPNLLGAEARRILSGLADRPVADGDIAREGQGRPFFPDRGEDFSISHSGALAAVSLVRGANLRTGCDVELVRERPGARAIAEEYFSASEKEFIFSHGRFHGTRFYRIWTLKECYLKLRGLSVFDMAMAPSFILDGDLAFDAPAASPLTFYLYELSGVHERYVLATAVEGALTEEPEIRWFSPAAEGSLACKCTGKIIASRILLPA